MSKLLPTPPVPPINRTRNRQPEEEDEDLPAAERRSVRPRKDGANALAQRNLPCNGQNHYPALDMGHGSAPRGHKGNSCSLTLVPLGQQARSAGLGPAHFQAISPLKADAELPPILTEVNPDSGSVAGGVRVWLKGMDFPALSPLFARFETAVVPTVRVYLRTSGFTHPACQTFASSNLLVCHSPPRATPGVIQITLSKHPYLNAPEYGSSIATFTYKGDLDEL